MKLCIDNRERLRIPLFEKYIYGKKSGLITGIETGNYACGDFFTPDGLVGIEYKKEDFVKSIYDEQLSKQLKELKDNFVHPYLFVGYDGIQDLIMNNIGVSPEVIIGQLSSVLARNQVTIMFVGDLLVPFTCKVIEKYYDGRTKVKNIVYTPIRRGVTPKEVKLDIISRIPKIGAKKGLKLLESFDNSIGNIANTSIEDLMKVSGIGKKLAKDIKEVLK